MLPMVDAVASESDIEELTGGYRLNSGQWAL
jgi:hypothetical protein